jgi:SAM-dependent methyltransferase
MALDYATVKQCRVCGSVALADVWAQAQQPLAGTYLEEGQLGQEPRLPLTVAYCRACTHVQLREVMPAEVYRTYRFVGTGSAGYRDHLEAVAESFVHQHGIRGKRVLELGCNNGHLLKLLRDRGGNEVCGFEPSTALARECQRDGLQVHNEFFGSKTAATCPLKPVDLIVVRHVLEHIDDLQDFVGAMRSVMAPAGGGLVLIEVPDLDSILIKKHFSHFYHEHISYFSAAALAKLMAAHGFVAVEQRIVDIHGGSLYAVFKALPAAKTESSAQPAPTLEALQGFVTDAQRSFEELRVFLEDLRGGYRKVVGYGAAQRTTTICSLAGLTARHVDYFVDKNPHLTGLYVPGIRLPIHAPQRLQADRPDVLVLFATSFEREIMQEQEAFRKAGGRFVQLFPHPRIVQ